MKTLLIILAVLLAVAVVAAVILNHPCFGRRMGKERKARIEQFRQVFSQSAKLVGDFSK